MRDSNTPRTTGHITVPSQDTTASAFADSTISYGESLRLSQFPHPPASIPTTPISSDFHSANSTSRTAPLIPRRRNEGLPTYTFRGQDSPSTLRRPLRAESGSDASASQTQRVPITFDPNTRDVSPYDWHEGASSIDVDASEDRLLSTSFITSLLREDSSAYHTRGTSIMSDAVSGISEMTYPPPMGHPTRPHVRPSRLQVEASQTYRQPQRGSLPTEPPASESLGHADDSDAGHSSQPTVIRKASITRGLRVQGASVVGMVPATLHNVSNMESLRSPFHSDPVKTPNSPIAEVDEQAPFGNGERLSSHGLSYPTSGGSGSQAYYLRGLSRHQTHDSTHTTRSVANSFISRLSSNRPVQRVLAWVRKPLPPLPIIPNMPVSAEIQHRRADDTTPLPDLVHRAGALHGMLEKGYHPHHSLPSDYSHITGPISPAIDEGGWSHTAKHRKPLPKSVPLWAGNMASARTAALNKKQRLIRLLVVAFIIVVVIVVAVAVGVTVTERNKKTPKCSNNQTGALCNLDATCVCTSTLPGRCNNLAKSLVDLVPTLNELLITNVTASNVYDSVWLAQGVTTGADCADQALLIDVAPALDVSTFSNRTAWAQSTLLWTLVQSQDLGVTRSLQAFIQEAPWSQLDRDGPVLDAGSSFSTTQSNFIYDFAAQTILPVEVSFIEQGQPTNAQIAQVNDIARQALDRMYSYASASSALRQDALATYWTNILGQRSDDLRVFISALSVSPIMLPFDASYSQHGHDLANLLTNSSAAPFPPPPACYPGLTPDESAQLQAIEGPIYGLPDSQVLDDFDTSCFPNRPIYGVLDVLHLRLPFPDQMSNVSRQAVVLDREVSPRAIIRSGSRLSTFPAAISNPDAPVNPRQYGTLNHFNHVILSYLQAMPSVDVAVTLVSYVLSTASSAPVHPGSDSLLIHSLPSLPLLEVAIFGTIDPSNVRSVASALSGSSGNLFFGSPQAAAMRWWAINAVSSAVVWAESATSQLIVQDNSFTNNAFNLTWDAAAVAIEHNVPGVGVNNITTAFQDTGLFTNV